MKLSIIIPVYKGENTIEPLFNKIKETLEGKFDYEVIFISDNAIDDSWERIKKLSAINPQQVKGYKLKHNYGQHRAILFGIKEAKGDYLITMDEDIQHDPKYIPQMLAFLLDNNLDVVYGNFVRFRKNGMRKIGSDLGRRIAVQLIPHLYKGYSPFRIVKTEIARSLDNNFKPAFIDGQLGRVTEKIGEYSIEHFENKRPSSYSFFKLILLGASIILGYSRLARIGLLILFIISFLLSANILVRTAGRGLGFLDILTIVVAGTLFISILANTFTKKRNKKVEIVEKAGIS